MSETIIKVEDLSKKYIIGHQVEKGLTFREMITRSATNIFNRAKLPDPSLEEFWALKEVSFEVNKGDRIGIIGRNGAGKSTLLKLLSRITEPTKGRISINGRIASLLEVGTGFHPELTGRENIYLNGAILGMSRREIKKKFEEIVAFAEVEKFLDTPVKRYSSGMYVRLAFAVAAHLEPEILIVDEVLAVGDAQFQKKCLGKMEDVSRGDGRTILFVSHNMSVVKSLCNKGMLLNKGGMEKWGDINDVVNLYENKISVTTEFIPIIIKELGIKIEKIVVNEKECGVVKSLKPLEIKIVVTAENDCSGIGFHVRLTNKSYAGDIFASRTHNFNNFKFFLKKGKNEVICRIEKFLLCSDEYSIDFGIDLPKIKMLFFEKDVLSFEVQETFFPDKAFSSLPEYGRVFMDDSWILN